MDDDLTGVVLGDDLLHSAVEIGRCQRRVGLTRLAQIGQEMLGAVMIFLGDVITNVFLNFLDLLFDDGVRDVSLVDFRHFGVRRRRFLRSAGSSGAKLTSGSFASFGRG